MMMGSAELRRTSSTTSSPPRSGRPRSSSMRSHSSVKASASASAAVVASVMWKRWDDRPVRSRRWICGASSTTRRLIWLEVMELTHAAKRQGEDGAAPICPIGGGDGAAHGRGEAAADGKAQTRTGLTARREAGGAIEDGLERRGGDAVALVADRDLDRGIARAHLDRDLGAGR